MNQRLERLIAALKESDSNLRRGAAITLGENGIDPRAVAPLFAALKDSDSSVRQGAAMSLAQSPSGDVMRDPRLAEPLIAALNDPVIRWDAADALVRIGTPSVEPLIGALKDKNELVRQGAAAALFEIGDPRAVNAGRAALRPEIAEAYIFLIKWGSPGSEDLMVQALRKFGNKKMAVEFLNSGNQTLAQAARDWAANRHYTIVTENPEFATVTWGSER